MQALRDLPTVALADDLHAAHAALDHWTDHVDDRFDADTQLALADRRYLALGHAHRAFYFTAEGCWMTEPSRLIDLGPSALVSPGSVRTTATRQGTICVLDTVAGTCEWHDVPVSAFTTTDGSCAAIPAA